MSFQTNLEKLSLYISISDKTIPDFHHNQSDAIANIRLYFTDDDLMIAYEQTSILHEEYFADKMSQIYSQFISQKQSASNLGFVQFVQFWVMRDQKLKVYYTPYDQLIQNIANEYINQITHKALQQKNPNKHIDIHNDLQPPCQKNKITISHPKQKQHKTIHQTPFQRLKFLHDHYCRKFIALPKNQSFESLQKFYNTINLSQWIVFAKEMNLLNCRPIQMKIDNGQSVQQKANNVNQQNPIQMKIDNGQSIEKKTNNGNQQNPIISQKKKIKPLKLDSYYFKIVFQRHSKQFAMDLPNFVEAVKEIVQKLYGISNFETQGYQKLGLNNQKMFKTIVEKIGDHLPASNIFLVNPNTVKLKSKSKKQKDFFLPKKDDMNKEEKIQEKRQKGIILNSPKKFYKSRQQKQQTQLLQKMNLQNLKKLKISKQTQSQLCDLIGDESLKYTEDNQSVIINKQKKEKMNKNTHLKDKNDGKQKEGIIERMDGRMRNVLNKIR